MGRTHLLGLAGLLGLAATFAACSATTETGDGFDNGDGSGGSGNTGTGGEPADDDGDFDGDVTVGVGGSSSSGTPTCTSDPTTDDDGDGLSEDQGDCNDCDPNAHPGSVEVIAADGGGGAGGSGSGGAAAAADEDCDGIVDNVAPPCDAGLALEGTDPMDGARAVDLCQQATGNKWGVISANYVRANGGVIPANLAVGILGDFGPNVATQGGSSMLAISSGHARRPSDPNFCGSTTCMHNGAGTPPPGFPQDTSGCPGLSNINDDVGFEVSLRSPKNATGYSFNFKFYSFEYPEYVCTSYNDQFISLVTPPPMGAIDGNISFDANNNPVSVNVAFFQVCPGCPAGEAELQGTGFEYSAGATTWLQTTAPITGGTEFTIRWAIWDTGDSALDSTALIDNFQWIANGGTPAVGTEPIPDPK